MLISLYRQTSHEGSSFSFSFERDKIQKLGLYFLRKSFNLTKILSFSSKTKNSKKYCGQDLGDTVIKLDYYHFYYIGILKNKKYCIR